MAKKIPALNGGNDPDAAYKGKVNVKGYWLTDFTGGFRIMGKYDLILPNNYDPAVSHPVIVSTQDDPSAEYMKQTDYIVVRCIKKGYQNNDTKEQQKNRCIIEDVALDCNIDPLRIYATGFSKGGHQSLKLGIRYPGWFAGLIPVHHDLMSQNFPYWKNLENLINTPTLLIHGAGDGYWEDTTYKYMLEKGCPVIEYLDGKGHTADWAFRENPQYMLDWADTVVMNPYPKIVQHTIEHPRYSRAYWTNCRMTQGTSGADLQYRVEVKENNLIDIMLIRNGNLVSCLELYLNSQLVDMGQNLVVNVDGQEKFNDMPSGKITVVVNGTGGAYSGVTTLLWQHVDSLRQEIFGYKPAYVYNPGHAVNAGNPRIQVGPNPFSTNLGIKILMQNANIKMQNAKLEIFDLAGRVVRATYDPPSADATYIWDASNQPAGSYLVRARVNNRTVTKKVIKIK
jgi:hypothetical protein